MCENSWRKGRAVAVEMTASWSDRSCSTSGLGKACLGSSRTSHGSDGRTIDRRAWHSFSNTNDCRILISLSTNKISTEDVRRQATSLPYCSGETQAKEVQSQSSSVKRWIRIALKAHSRHRRAALKTGRPWRCARPPCPVALPHLRGRCRRCRVSPPAPWETCPVRCPVQTGSCGAVVVAGRYRS